MKVDRDSKSKKIQKYAKFFRKKKKGFLTELKVSKVQIIKYFVLIRNTAYVNYKDFMKYRNINKKIIFLETPSINK